MKQSLQIDYHGPLAKVSDAGMPGFTLTKQALENTLANQGYKTTRDALRFLVTARIAHAVPLHLRLACQLASDPVALRRLQGISLDEFLLELMGFERVRLRLSRRFFKTYRSRAGQEEPLWWAAEHLERALQVSLSEVRRIDSAKQLLREGECARQALVGEGYSLLPQP